MTELKISAQQGPQTQFLSTDADIAIYGGAAGGGKTFALLLEPIRHHGNSEFGCVVFRRNSTQVRNTGGLWSESEKIYPLLGAHPREAALSWEFPSGMTLRFSHLEYDKTVLDWQGAQIALMGFDELTHFTEKQFFYMLSRNRSTSGVKPYIRATTNPDPDSWVIKFIDWWIDKDGFAIPERSGAVRYFVRMNDSLMWFDSKEQVHEKLGNGPEIQPKSVTFIAAKLEDNKILMDKNPEYLANLLALNKVDRMRLKDGNWKIRGNAGMFFQRDWFKVVDFVPEGWIGMVRYWDRAATVVTPDSPDPDWTRGLKMYKYPNGNYVVVDLKGTRDTPMKVEQMIVNTASQDSNQCPVAIEQDPGSSGVADKDNYVRLLSGYQIIVNKPSVDKVTRAKPVSAQSEHNNIMILRAPWNEDFFTELENFSEDDVGHDDIVDVFSGAFNYLAQNLSWADAI